MMFNNFDNIKLDDDEVEVDSSDRVLVFKLSEKSLFQLEYMSNRLGESKDFTLCDIIDYTYDLMKKVEFQRESNKRLMKINALLEKIEEEVNDMNEEEADIHNKKIVNELLTGIIKGLD